jgi:hypothetical protein
MSHDLLYNGNVDRSSCARTIYIGHDKKPSIDAGELYSVALEYSKSAMYMKVRS